MKDMKGLLGKKLGMTQVFGEDDRLIPATVIEAGPCFVAQIKTQESDGYEAIQIGFETKKEKKLNRPEKGHLKKSGLGPLRYLAELRVASTGDFKLGQELTVADFSEVKVADVVGVTKGKGFAGGMKRWGFSGGPGGHGSHFHRRVGSIGMAATPSRVTKGRKLPGRLGGARQTMRNLSVIKVDVEQNIILVRGAVPGANGSLVLIKESKKAVTAK